MQSGKVRLYGRFRITTPSGEPVAFRTTKAAELVALLALQPNGAMSRTSIAQCLWPDRDSSEQLKNLRPALHYAKTALGDDCFETSTDGESRLILNSQSDWHEVKRLDLRMTAEEDPRERLVLLFALAELVRHPLLESWKHDWIEPYRLRHARMQFRVFHRLAEELSLRNEITSALDYAQFLADLDPLNEQTVRLQLRLLGQAGRAPEAQHLYREYRAQLKEALDLDVSPELKETAQKVVSGGYSGANVKTVPSAQLEMVQTLLTMLAEDSPERLLPLLAAPEVNWVVVTHGAELRTILETVIDKTEGWNADRAGAAKRLLQFYSQEGEYQKMRRLASKLMDSEQPVDHVAALNYLGEAAINQLQEEAADKYFASAQLIAESLHQPYLCAISAINRALACLAFANFEGAKRHMSSAFQELTNRSEPNARFTFGRALASLAHIEELRGDHLSADQRADEWNQLALMDQAVRQDSSGLAVLGLIRARQGDPASANWCVQALDCALNGRRKFEMVVTGLLVCNAGQIRGIETAAVQAAAQLHPWILEYHTELLPFDRHMLKAAGVVSFEPPTSPLASLPKILVELRDAFECR